MDDHAIAGPNILSELPALATAVAAEHGQHRDYVALSRYYGLDGGKRWILEDIGRDFGLTRERVRQLRNRLTRRVRAFLIEAEPAEAGELGREAREIGRLLRSGPMLSRQEEVAAQLASRYGRELTDKEQAALPLLLVMIGVVSYSARTLGLKDNATYWSPRGPLDVREISKINSVLAEHLAERPQGTTWRDLSVAASRAAGRDVGLEETKRFTSLVANIREKGDGVRVPFELLSSNACRAVRILWDEGDPLHFRVIAERITARYAELGLKAPGADALGLSKHLSLDPRFQPVGRSGRWMLATWTHVRGDSVASLMEEILAKRGEPVPYDDIWDFVHRMRPDVKRSTIFALVHVFSDRFVRIKKAKLALATWDLDPAKVQPRRRIKRRRTRRRRRNTVRGKVARVVRDTLREHPEHTAKLRELRKMVRERANVKDPTIYWVITAMSDTRKFDKGNVRYVRLVESDDEWNTQSRH